jgi:GrpB-like predicted nucleotidyltransferase (UPF0157 family)
MGRTPSGGIELVEWQPRWTPEFEGIRERLATSFGELAIAIEHVGSTSVPGLAAKDVIDVQVSVASLEPSEPVHEALRRADMDPDVFDPPIWDHIPPGWKGPPERWHKLFGTAPEGARRVNVHVRVRGGPNERYALLFRDFLRATPDARQAWGRFKTELARIADDIEDYVEVKDPATDVLMITAERWAADTGWSPLG